jgi:DMSO reductase anchor subunit
VRPSAEGPGEAPLVAFTLLVQTAVGALWAMLWLLRRAEFLPMLLTGACLGVGMLMSFAHLGTKRNAWRALSHLRKSWLSREILYTLVFAAGWLATLAALLLGFNTALPGVLTGLVGLWLIHCMSRVYALRTVPAWNSWRTQARFFISAGLLGTLAVLPFAGASVSALERGAVALLVIALLVVEGLISAPQVLSGAGRRLQLALLAVAVLSAASLFFVPGWLRPGFGIVALLTVLAEQVVGRWYFYEARVRQAAGR